MRALRNLGTSKTLKNTPTKHTIMNSSHRAPRGLLRENAPTHLSLQLHSLRSYLSSGFRPAGRKRSNVLQMQAAFKHLLNMLI